jgi:uncharacterized membrane-anchored protein
MTKSAKVFCFLVLAQAGFLLSWAGYHEYVRQRSEVIVLKGRPVDPQDLLRGDYMILGYDISTVPGSDAAKPEHFGEDIWVLLEKRDRYHVAVKASRERIEPGPGQVLVRGETGYAWSGGPDHQIDYGIEKYFVPEGMGTPRFQLMEVEVSVSPAHRLYIKRVLLDGKAFP